MLSQNIHAEPYQAFNHWKIHGIKVILAKQARCNVYPMKGGSN